MSFDEWKERQESLGNEVDSWSAWVFQQAKIDELQKRIDEAVKKLESIKADSLRPSHHDYDKGWRDCAIAVLNDLRGEKND